DVVSSFGAGYVVNADGSRVVFVANRESANIRELWSSDGLHPPVKLSGAMIAQSFVVDPPELSADGAWVFSPPAANVIGRREPFRAPIDGSSAPVKLSGSVTGGGGVQTFQVTPSGARVVFNAFGASTVHADLFSAPSDGSAAPTKLNPAYVGSGV